MLKKTQTKPKKVKSTLDNLPSGDWNDDEVMENLTPWYKNLPKADREDSSFLLEAAKKNDSFGYFINEYQDGKLLSLIKEYLTELHTDIHSEDEDWQTKVEDKIEDCVCVYDAVEIAKEIASGNL